MLEWSGEKYDCEYDLREANLNITLDRAFTDSAFFIFFFFSVASPRWIWSAILPTLY